MGKRDSLRGDFIFDGVIEVEEKDVAQLKWYEKHWVIWLLTIFLAPVGLFLMWRYSRHGMVIKILATLFFGGAFLVALTNKPANDASRQQNQPAQVEQKAPEKTYYAVDVSTMMSDLNGNAAAAQKKYKGQNLAVTGIVQVIDSDGEYILLTTSEWDIIGVQCFLNKRDKAQENFLMNVRKGQTVTAYGTISDVGEVLGYALKVDVFK